MTEEKVRALGMAVYGIAQKYGAGTIMWGDYVPPPSENIIPTGIKELDKALGIGGLPMGRVVEIYSTDKILCLFKNTSMALHCSVHTQRHLDREST